MARLLLINPSYRRTYGSNHAGIANPVYPILSLAVLAGAVRRAGHAVKILDLSYLSYDPNKIKDEIKAFKADAVGITATTPLVNQLRDISFLARDVSRSIITIGGGAHASALPLETMRESLLDFLVQGEGDISLPKILDGDQPQSIGGIYWRHAGEIYNNPRPELIGNLDDLAMPAWDLYPIDEYKKRLNKILVRNPPVSTIEFSRGCVFDCDFCASKNTMGRGYRKKSPERCAEEMALLEKLGYGEALLTDDIFTSDNGWAMSVCESIRERKLKIVWTCTNGIRVDSANRSLFDAMKRSGCYRVHFGFETGNEQVLKAFGKGGKATLDQGIAAVKLARKAGLDTWGMYMFGLSPDTPETMEDTIRYAKRTPVDVMKFGITVPFPGTPMFNEMRLQGRIKTLDWDQYNVYNEARSIFEHPRLSWDQVTSAYRKAYLRLYYMNPPYLLRRLWRGIKTGEFIWDIYFAVKFRVLLSKQPEDMAAETYAHKNEWSKLNASLKDLHAYEVMRARSSRPPVAGGPHGRASNLRRAHPRPSSGGGSD